jgi:tetratricopeptide (TPR) repeat protein
MTAALLALWLAWLPGAAAQGAWLQEASAPLDGPVRLFEAGRYDEVIKQLEDSVQRLRSKDQRQGYYYLGLAYERLGRLDKALGVYQLGVKLFPRDLNLLTQLGQLLHTSGLEEQAEPIFQKVLRIHPNNSAAHLGLAEIDHSLGFFDRSAEHYEKALETRPDNPVLWRDYAEVLISARDYKTGALAAQRSLSLRDDADAAVDLARAQRGADRLPEALDTLTAAASRFPARADVALARALWLLEAGREEDALAGVEPLLAAPTPPPLAYWIRARVRLKSDQYRAAVEDLRLAAAAERASPFVAAAAKELLKQLGSE